MTHNALNAITITQKAESACMQRLNAQRLFYQVYSFQNDGRRAVAESFFHTLKAELVHHEDFQTRNEAKQAIFEYIEVYYNRQRKHSGNGYLAPFKYEQELAKAA